jgi:hypothetical protein
MTVRGNRRPPSCRALVRSMPSVEISNDDKKAEGT